MEQIHEKDQEIGKDDSFDGENRPKIPKDDGFKTCQSMMPTPKLRRTLRMTAARTSILTGGKPYKEVGSSGKKFNSRKKAAANKSGKLNDTTINSNDTFIRHERDIFDRDSLDYVFRSPSSLNHHDGPRTSEVKPRANSFRTPTNSPPPTKANSPKKPSDNSLPTKSPMQKSTKKLITRPPTTSPAKVTNLTKPKPTALQPATNPRARPIRQKYLPQQQQRTTQLKLQSQQKPRFLTGGKFNNNINRPKPAGRLTRPGASQTRDAQYKSTAELEKEYFNSLRSRF